MHLQQRFPIVGIAVSAGGLRPLEQFLESLPADTAMALILMAHLPQEEATFLSLQLHRLTKLPVQLARKNLVIKPGHIYVCPAGQLVTVMDGHFRLRAMGDAVHRFPIDCFLRSLAVEQKTDAVGVLLSVGGVDGTRGLRTVKDHGGLTIAHESDVAAREGVVDLILRAEELGAALAEFNARKRIETAQMQFDSNGAFADERSDDLDEHADTIIFESGNGRDAAANDEALPLRRMEQELRETRNRLQSTQEEYSAALRELRFSNAELRAINEELQTAIEEFDKSRQELQYVNDELSSVNAELSEKVEDLSLTNTRLRSVLTSIGIALIVVDRNLVIRGFTPAVTAMLKLLREDLGRPLTDIAGRLGDYGNLNGEVRAVFEKGVPLTRRIFDAGRAAEYTMRILPYRSSERSINGVLLVFDEATNRG